MTWLCIVAALSACSLTNKVFTSSAAEKHAKALLHLQLRVMRFADEYSTRIAEPLQQFQDSTTDAKERLAAQNWKITQMTAAYTIASGPNPELNAIDMVVFATLSRIVIDDLSITERFGARADSLRATHARLEELAWSGAEGVLSPAQVAELKGLIDEWRAKNPHSFAVAHIHFDDFAKALGRPEPGAPITPGSLFSFLGIDPLSNLDPAVRELAQARWLAERALYFAQRTPNLVDAQVERMTLQLVTMPETVDLLDDINRTSVAAQQTGNLAATLPEVLSKERAATIDQLMGVLDSRQTEMRALLGEVRSTLDAGAVTSDAMKAMIVSFDKLMERFDTPDTSSPTASTTPSKPFDILEYATTARDLGATARELDLLFARVDKDSAALAAVSAQASERMHAVVDHMYWRVVQVIVILVSALVLGALIYRFVARRIAPSMRS